MKVRVTILSRDDKTEVFDCDSFPNIQSDFTTLYFSNRRTTIPSEAIARIEQEVLEW